MKIIFKEPNKPAVYKEVPNELEDLQELVDGWVEAHTITEDMVIICNEEGRIRQMPFNCHVFVDWVGPIAFVGCKGDEFCDVPISLEDARQLYGLEVQE